MNKLSQEQKKTVEHIENKLCIISPWPWSWAERNKKTEDLGAIQDSNKENICSFGNCTQYYPSEGEEPAEINKEFIIHSPEYIHELLLIINKLA